MHAIAMFSIFPPSLPPVFDCIIYYPYSKLYKNLLPLSRGIKHFSDEIVNTSFKNGFRIALIYYGAICRCHFKILIDQIVQSTGKT